MLYSVYSRVWIYPYLCEERNRFLLLLIDSIESWDFTWTKNLYDKFNIISCFLKFILSFKSKTIYLFLYPNLYYISLIFSFNFKISSHFFGLSVIEVSIPGQARSWQIPNMSQGGLRSWLTVRSLGTRKLSFWSECSQPTPTQTLADAIYVFIDYDIPLRLAESSCLASDSGEIRQGCTSVPTVRWELMAPGQRYKVTT